MALYALGDLAPTVHPDAFIHPDATVIGDVRIGAESTVWPHAVLRGDYGRIVIGARTSIQDGTVIHVPGGPLETIIGDDCVVGHVAHLEGCVVEDGCLIGSGSIVLHGVVVGRGAIVGANAVVTNGTKIPPGAMALGVPARVREGVAPRGHAEIPVSAYVENGKRYRRDLRRLDG
jgi:carbonic anhydrase/acetyltransferase-like protein (isoleucine patch superfamily)